jgi:hypothetical protein
MEKDNAGRARRKFSEGLILIFEVSRRFRRDAEKRPARRGVLQRIYAVKGIYLHRRLAGAQGHFASGCSSQVRTSMVT